MAFVATPALANAPAPYSRPTGAVPGMVVLRQSSIVVEHEELAIDCSKNETPIHPTCTFVATYSLFNPAADDEEILGAFYTVQSSRKEVETVIRARLGDVDASGEATEEQLAKMDAIVREDPAARNAQLHRAPFHTTVRANTRAMLVFEGTLDPVRFSDHNPREGYSLPAIVARHPFGASSKGAAWDDSDEDFLYLVSPITSWRGDPDVHITIRHRPGNDFEATSPTFKETQAGVHEATIKASSKQNVAFHLSYRPSPIHHGGPVLGIGPRLGREELRVRLGYEVGIKDNFILGVMGETNFDEYVKTALTIDAATPCMIFIFPALSFGAGAVMEWRRDQPTRAGVRAQIGMSWPILSLSFPVDIYPVANSSGTHAEAAFMTTVSF